MMRFEGSKRGSRLALAAGVLGASMLLAGQALAHTDPSGRTDTGIGASMRAFRADGVTPVGDGTVTECEMIFYQATLNPQAGAVAFEQGSWSITTPDGVAHDVTPVGGIPCVGGTVDDAAMPGGRGNCAPTIDHIDSILVMYTVNPANINAFGQITARTDYINGFSHKGVNDTFGANAGIAFPIDVVCSCAGTSLPTCADTTACNGLDVCNANTKFEIVDPTHFRKGTCVPGTPVVCPQCKTCSEPSGTCVVDNGQVGTPCTGPAAAECQSPVCQADGSCANAPDATKNSNPCGTDTAGDCVHPGCENGVCAPAHTKDVADTPCTTTTPGQCQHAVCNDNGMCISSPDTGQVGQPCTGPPTVDCQSPVCQADGTCLNQADNNKTSNPCGTDTPGDCVHPGCEAGVCVPAHTKDTAGSPCATGNPGECQAQACDDTGTCVVTNDSSRNNTPCTGSGPDTPGDCHHPCCEDGICVADAIGCRDPDSTPCTDTDGNACTVAGCNASGVCDQLHVGSSVPCDDGNLCTTEACNPTTGQCETTSIVMCPDDGNPCTMERCDPATGMCVSSATGGGLTFLVRRFGQFGNGSDIGGGVGANDLGGFLQFGKHTLAEDNTVLEGDTVKLGEGSNVFSVLANHVRFGPAVNVRGPKGPAVLPIQVPFCPIPSFTCGTNGVTVPGSQVSNLGPGTYGHLRLLNGATLTLGAGTYNFCSLSTGRFSSIFVTGGMDTTINIVGDFRLANGSFLGPDANTPLPAVNIGGTSVRIGRATILEAFVSAPNAVFSFGRGSTLIGTFCADSTRSDKNITLECPATRTIPPPQ